MRHINQKQLHAVSSSFFLSTSHQLWVAAYELLRKGGTISAGVLLQKRIQDYLIMSMMGIPDLDSIQRYKEKNLH